MTQPAKGELLGILTRLGFTATPNVVVFAPNPNLSAAQMESLSGQRKPRLVIHINGSPLVVTEIGKTRGLRRLTDYYGQGTYQGKMHRFYLTNGGNRFIDGYLQPVTNGRQGQIILEEE